MIYFQGMQIYFFLKTLWDFTIQDRIHRELTEMYHISVDRKYYQIISQVHFSHTFLFIFFPLP